MKLYAFIVVVFSAACARATAARQQADAAGTTADAPGTDGQVVVADAPRDTASPDAMVDSGQGGAVRHLLLSEIVLAPTAGELIEIVNPSSQPVDLGDYYLADSPHYFELPSATPALDGGDFIARFPAGATLAGHAVVTVAIDTTASFTTTYGMPPTYSIASATMRVIATNAATLTNSGEPVVLFRWDGQADRVTDVDIMIAGSPSSGNMLLDKSAVAIDGPDSGSTTTAYASDARTLAAQAATPATGQSTKRIALETGHELESGTGNGMAGDDETSEATAFTWDTAYSAPTPGTVPAALLP